MNYYRFFFLLFMILGLSNLAGAQEKYAVLITGNYSKGLDPLPLNSQWNGGQGQGGYYDEFWNDIYLMWEMLTKPDSLGGKGFLKDNVYVLYGSGQDYYLLEPNVPMRYRPLPGEIVTDYPARRSKVDMVLTGFADGSNGFHELTDDDFLFIWSHGHGVGSNGNSSLMLEELFISDIDFANLVDSIKAVKKVYWMQQCHSGGFVEELEGDISFFHSACLSDEKALRADNMPVMENEPINGDTCHHGEFNFHMYSSTNGETPIKGITTYNNEPLSNADLNNDNCISVYEAYNWEVNHETRIETPVMSDIGSIGSTTSLRFPTLMFEDITSSDSHRGIIGVTKDVRVMPGQTLTLYDKAKVHFINDAKITVEAGASLVIGDNVEFIMDDPHGTSDPSHSAIIVRGNISIGSNVKFSSQNGHDWKGLNFDAMTTSYTLQGIEFDHCGIYGSVTVSNS